MHDIGRFAPYSPATVPGFSLRIPRTNPKQQQR
jgi:hypothetical protein